MSGKTFRTCYIMNFAHRNKLANYFLLECDLARRVLKRAVKMWHYVSKMCQVFQESFDIRDEPNNSNLHLYCEPNWTACFSGSYFFFWKRSFFLSSDDSVLGMKR